MEVLPDKEAVTGKETLSDKETKPKHENAA